MKKRQKIGGTPFYGFIGHGDSPDYLNDPPVFIVFVEGILSESYSLVNDQIEA